MQSAGGPQFNGRGVMVQVMQSSGTPLQRPRVAQPVSIIWKFIFVRTYGACSGAREGPGGGACSQVQDYQYL